MPPYFSHNFEIFSKISSQIFLACRLQFLVIVAVYGQLALRFYDKLTNFSQDKIWVIFTTKTHAQLHRSGVIGAEGYSKTFAKQRGKNFRIENEKRCQQIFRVVKFHQGDVPL